MHTVVSVFSIDWLLCWEYFTVERSGVFGTDVGTRAMFEASLKPV